MAALAELAERDEERRVKALCPLPGRVVAVAGLGVEGADPALGAVRRSGTLRRKPRVAGARTEWSAGLGALLHSPAKAQT